MPLNEASPPQYNLLDLCMTTTFSRLKLFWALLSLVDPFQWILAECHLVFGEKIGYLIFRSNVLVGDSFI